jgi:hypothetical protein
MTFHPTPLYLIKYKENSPFFNSVMSEILVSFFWTAQRQCWGSVTCWCGSGYADPYLWVMDPDPNPTPDPTPLFSDFKDAKKIFFSYNLPAGTLSSVLKIQFLLKFVSEFYFASILEKREESGSGSIRLTNGYGSGSGSRSPTPIKGTAKEVFRGRWFSSVHGWNSRNSIGFVR